MRGYNLEEGPASCDVYKSCFVRRGQGKYNYDTTVAGLIDASEATSPEHRAHAWYLDHHVVVDGVLSTKEIDVVGMAQDRVWMTDHENE
ncbi:hypothetical protein QTP88_019150 [Uroleucon formosanum]